MTHLRSLVIPSAVILSSLVFGSTAFAQATAPPPPPPPPPPVHATDGVRFRGAIAASGGAEFASGFGVGMGGLEGRLGVQINNLIGVYVQPHFSLGSGTVSGSSLTVFTGTAGVDGLVDFTFVNRFFVGVGGGFGVLNNPIGPDVHIRLGGYPLMGFGENGYTRKGLMVGVETRIYFLSDASSSLTVAQVMGTIGYEAF